MSEGLGVRTLSRTHKPPTTQELEVSAAYWNKIKAARTIKIQWAIWKMVAGRDILMETSASFAHDYTDAQLTPWTTAVQQTFAALDDQSQCFAMQCINGGAWTLVCGSRKFFMDYCDSKHFKYKV